MINRKNNCIVALRVQHFFYCTRSALFFIISLGLILSLTGISLALEPILYNVKVNDISDEGVTVIKPWKTIVLDKEYRGAWVLAGDLTGDGQVEIVSARNFTYGQAPADSHYTTSVVVHRLDGSVLWKWGDPNTTTPF